jgi:dihydroorotate dehydrogenase
MIRDTGYCKLQNPGWESFKSLSVFMSRYGFNSVGHDEVVERLTSQNRTPQSSKLGVLGINLGKNKTSTSAVQDYVEGVENFAKFADYITINVSSPNTPGLRSLQGKNELSALLKEVK